MIDSEIRDLAVIGERHTAAIVGRDGAIVWYCPDRFDRPSLLASLLDRGGGSWRVDMPGMTPGGRRYLGDSGVLETRLNAPAGSLVIIDWMPVGAGLADGTICRLFSTAPDDVDVTLEPRPDYARRRAEPRVLDDGSADVDGQRLYTSHPLEIEGDAIRMTIPAGYDGWAVLSGATDPAPASARLDQWLAGTLDYWSAMPGKYTGPYEAEVVASLRAIRLLTHEQTGGIIAAATTSLPEAAGGEANWDYRYVWLRDAGMIVSALTRLEGCIEDGRRYLEFICRSRSSSADYPVPVFTTLDGETAPAEEHLDLAGYAESQPVRVGNDAREQLQLDAFGNVILAAKLIYRHTEERPHWDTVEQIADFLVEHWRDPDHGIWEEPVRRQYTAGKVIAACALDSAAEFSTDEAQAGRWRAAVAEIRAYVAENCLTPDGAYAVAAGSDEVDVSAALFPVWAYTAADAPEMVRTIAALERDWSWKELLYWRRLECSDARKEGAFLAGTFWVAQYWVTRGDLDRARGIIDAALAYANDLGLFAEEADPRTGRMVGNIPQTFVHAAFLGVVVDLKAALEAASQPAEQE